MKVTAGAIGFAIMAAVGGNACGGDPQPFEVAGCGAAPADPARLERLVGLPADSDVPEEDRELAIDIVFVPEGYRASDMDEYRAAVAELIAGLRADSSGIVARSPDIFNFHRLDVESTTADIANANRQDTAFGGCLDRHPEDPDPGHLMLYVDDEAVRFAATENIASPDIVVVLVNSEFGRANTSLGTGSTANPATILFRREYGATGLTHELGHALIGLGDEYVEIEGCFDARLPVFSTTDDPLAHLPNLSTEPTGQKWRTLVQGAEPGGAQYSDCIFHPTDSCRMLSATAPQFCPVCRSALETFFAARRGGADDGPPHCAIELNQSPTNVDNALVVTVRAVDRDGVDRIQVFLDGAPFVAWPGDGWHLATDWLPGSLLTPGDHVLLIECIDEIGTSSTAEVALTKSST